MEIHSATFCLSGSVTQGSSLKTFPHGKPPEASDYRLGKQTSDLQLSALCTDPQSFFSLLITIPAGFKY